MAHASKVGRQAEQLAENYLVSNGYEILKTNWRFGNKELDIISIFREKLVVVEVKSRTRSIYLNPGEVVPLSKQRNIITATEAFISRFNITMPVRFDIISVVFSGYEFRIEHIKNAFIPEIE